MTWLFWCPLEKWRCTRTDAFPWVLLGSMLFPVKLQDQNRSITVLKCIRQTATPIPLFQCWQLHMVTRQVSFKWAAVVYKYLNSSYGLLTNCTTASVKLCPSWHSLWFLTMWGKECLLPFSVMTSGCSGRDSDYIWMQISSTCRNLSKVHALAKYFQQTPICIGYIT